MRQSKKSAHMLPGVGWDAGDPLKRAGRRKDLPWCGQGRGAACMNDAAREGLKIDDVLEIRIAGQPTLWQQGRQLRSADRRHIPIGVENRSVPEADAADSIVLDIEPYGLDRCRHRGAVFGQRFLDWFDE